MSWYRIVERCGFARKANKAAIPVNLGVSIPKLSIKVKIKSLVIGALVMAVVSALAQAPIGYHKGKRNLWWSADGTTVLTDDQAAQQYRYQCQMIAEGYRFDKNGDVVYSPYERKQWLYVDDTDVRVSLDDQGVRITGIQEAPATIRLQENTICWSEIGGSRLEVRGDRSIDILLRSSWVSLLVDERIRQSPAPGADATHAKP